MKLIYKCNDNYSKILIKRFLLIIEEAMLEEITVSHSVEVDFTLRQPDLFASLGQLHFQVDFNFPEPL